MQRVEESNLAEEDLVDLSYGAVGDIAYKVVEDSTQRRGAKLVDSQGFSYTRKRPNFWRCVKRNKHLTCKATVKQQGDAFIRGVHEHIHEPDASNDIVAEVISEMRDRASSDPFSSAAEIVENVVRDCVGDQPTRSLPSLNNLTRQANRLKQNRPKNPSSLDFEVNEDYIPEEFLQKDIIVGEERHLIFATNTQVRLG